MVKRLPECWYLVQVIEELTRRLQKSDDARENHLHEIQSLRGKLSITGAFQKVNHF